MTHSPNAYLFLKKLKIHCYTDEKVYKEYLSVVPWETPELETICYAGYQGDTTFTSSRRSQMTRK